MTRGAWVGTPATHALLVPPTSLRRTDCVSMKGGRHSFVVGGGDVTHRDDLVSLDGFFRGFGMPGLKGGTLLSGALLGVLAVLDAAAAASRSLSAGGAS